MNLKKSPALTGVIHALESFKVETNLAIGIHSKWNQPCPRASFPFHAKKVKEAQRTMLSRNKIT